MPHLSLVQALYSLLFPWIYFLVLLSFPLYPLDTLFSFLTFFLISYLFIMNLTKCSGNNICLLKLYKFMRPIHQSLVFCHIPSIHVDSSLDDFIYSLLSTINFHYFPHKYFMFCVVKETMLIHRYGNIKIGWWLHTVFDTR